MRVRIQHTTRYAYSHPVTLHPHLVRLAPAPHVAESLLTYNLQLSPEPHLNWQTDPWGNRIATLTFVEDSLHTELEVRVDASFDLHPKNPFDFFLDERVRTLPFDYPDGWAHELAPFLRTDDVHADVRAFLEDLPAVGETIAWLVALNQKVAGAVDYVIRMEPGIQAPHETLSLGSGSCRDSAWLLVHCARAVGLAARFVSGYAIQLEDEGDIPGLPTGVSRDVIDLHAWAEVFVPGAGWTGLDGTSGLLCGEGHIPLATAVVPELASPITGAISGLPDEGETTFDVQMSVERIGHEPRPRRPYADEEWDALLQAADHVDASLRDAGIRLTVGGEPTWNSRDFPREPEWNTEAMGPTKWQQAVRFTGEIRARLGAGAFAMHRFGKQYPGESLPRWALHLMWRDDGVPIWRNPARLDFTDVAAESPPLHAAEARARQHESRTLHASQLQLAEHLCTRITRQLGIASAPLPVFEDPWALTKTEAHLPPDVDPSTLRFDADEDRRRLAESLERGIDAPRGYVVPVQAWQGRWLTGEWQLRRPRIYLVPGDSPIGLRLPLDRLAGTPGHWGASDPMAIRTPLAFDPRDRPPVRMQQRGATEPPDVSDAEPAADDASARDGAGLGVAIHTAMAVEPRHGVLHVFVPPTPTTEAFLEFIAAVEDAAEELGVSVRLEGYPPPADSRLNHCLVTPDPGVIEVNIPPFGSTRAYADFMAMLQDAARHAGLWCEKFQLDGRATGTGGGNHVTLGGPSAPESPFVLRPALLAGLVRFFQHHPSLSYLFTGLFVGPTCQAPRVDEGRMDALWELELALSQLDRAGTPPPPWFTDRLLRNLLADLSGNTHRAEICIDKLYNPSSATGRLGIVELRAFEMPPHERMAVAQVALVRAIVAALAAQPYDAPLIAHGPALHDRYMLPYFLWKDLRDVLGFLERRGVGLPESAYQPFVDYRFPLFGEVVAEGMRLEVRQALEPWPVLGEEPSGATVSRYVDSSLERVELRVHGFDPERYALAVNGLRLPLTPIDAVGGYVVGVRFRAWQPPHCLQPHIGLHHPLRIDLVDAWGQRSVAGCTYHVWHHEGRAFTEAPLTEFEAKARRRARFTKNNHMPYPARPARAARHPGHRVTVDLRWSGNDRQAPTELSE